MIFKKIEEHYKNHPSINECDVKCVQNWIHNEPHLPNITEFEAMMFLHACHNDVEAAKKRMETYYTFRTHCPEFYSDRDVNGEDLKTAMEIITFVPLPGVTPDGTKVLYFRFNTPDPSKFVVSHAMKFLAIVMESVVLSEGLSEGYMFLVDMSNYTIGHVAKLELLTIRKCMIYLQEGLPVRLKGFHFINTPHYIDTILSLMRPFMRKSFDDVMKFHIDIESAYETVPKCMFPHELGGDSGTRATLRGKHYQFIKDTAESYLEEERTRRVDEKKRHGKAKKSIDLLCGLLTDVNPDEHDTYQPIPVVPVKHDLHDILHT